MESSYTEIQEDMLCFLYPIGKAGMFVNRKATLIYAVQKECLCLYNWKCRSSKLKVSAGKSKFSVFH